MDSFHPKAWFLRFCQVLGFLGFICMIKTGSLCSVPKMRFKIHDWILEWANRIFRTNQSDRVNNHVSYVPFSVTVEIFYMKIRFNRQLYLRRPQICCGTRNNRYSNSLLIFIFFCIIHFVSVEEESFSRIFYSVRRSVYHSGHHRRPQKFFFTSSPVDNFGYFYYDIT